MTRESLQNRLHLAVVIACAWLILTSPWLAMLRRIPGDAGWIEWSHVVVGFAGLLLGLVYAVACARGGRWRLYFPWLAGTWRPVARDLAALVRGRLPSAEGGGLFAVLEGLLLLALLVVGVSGATWFGMQGDPEALTCRDVHIVGARVLIGLLFAHVVAVASHLVGLA